MPPAGSSVPRHRARLALLVVAAVLAVLAADILIVAGRSPLRHAQPESVVYVGPQSSGGGYGLYAYTPSTDATVPLYAPANNTFDGALSPQKDAVAQVTSLGGRSTLIYQHFSDAPQILDSADLSLFAPVWSSDGAMIAYATLAVKAPGEPVSVSFETQDASGEPGKTSASSTAYESVAVFSLAQGAKTLLPYDALPIGFSPDGGELLVNYQGALATLDLSASSSAPVPVSGITPQAFSPGRPYAFDGTHLAYADGSSVSILTLDWNAGAFTPLSTLSLSAKSIAFDGANLLVWDGATLHRYALTAQGARETGSLSFAPDGATQVVAWGPLTL